MNYIFWLFLFFCNIAIAADVKLGGVTVWDNYLKNGEEIISGEITCNDKHSGFRLWLGNQSVTNANSSNYVIYGENNRQHKLMIKLGGQGWKDYIDSNALGVSKSSQEINETFYIISPVSQRVLADRYIVTVIGECVK